MKNKILLILIIFMAILAIVTYILYNYRINLQELQKINNEFKTYANTQMLGTELISIMNRVQDINTKNKIEKESDGLYIDNGKNSIKLLGGKIDKIEEFTLPKSDNRRNLILIKKERQTPGKYPRKPGIPSKEPLY